MTYKEMLMQVKETIVSLKNQNETVREQQQDSNN